MSYDQPPISGSPSPRRLQRFGHLTSPDAQPFLRQSSPKRLPSRRMLQSRNPKSPRRPKNPGRQSVGAPLNCTVFRCKASHDPSRSQLDLALAAARLLPALEVAKQFGSHTFGGLRAAPVRLHQHRKGASTPPCSHRADSGLSLSFFGERRFLECCFFTNAAFRGKGRAGRSRCLDKFQSPDPGRAPQTSSSLKSNLRLLVSPGFLAQEAKGVNTSPYKTRWMAN